MERMPDQVVSLTDFSETSANASKRAAEFALLMKRPMTLLHISESVPIPSLADASLRNQLLEEDLQVKRSLLEQDAKTLKQSYPNLALTTRCIANAAFEIGIERYLQEFPSSILVLGKKNKTALEKIFVGSNITRLLRNGHFPVPLLLIPQQQQAIELKHLILAVNLRQKLLETNYFFIEKLIEAHGVTLGIVYSQGKEQISTDEAKVLLKKNLPDSLVANIQRITLVGKKEDIPNIPYVEERPTDIVVAFPEKKGFLESLVNGSFSDYLAENYQKPLLLIPQS